MPALAAARGSSYQRFILAPSAPPLKRPGVAKKRYSVILSPNDLTSHGRPLAPSAPLPVVLALAGARSS